MTDPNIIAELRATAQQMREEHEFDEKGNVGCRSSDPCGRCYLASNVVMLAERAEQAERERDAARDTLRRLGVHTKDCAVYRGGCDCGFDAALTTAPARHGGE